MAYEGEKGLAVPLHLGLANRDRLTARQRHSDELAGLRAGSERTLKHRPLEDGTLQREALEDRAAKLKAVELKAVELRPVELNPAEDDTEPLERQDLRRERPNADAVPRQ